MTPAFDLPEYYPRMKATKQLTLTLMVPSLFAGCQHASNTGRSSFTFVDQVGAPPAAPVDASKMKIVESMSVVIPPKPAGSLVLPTYPAAALKAHLQDIHLAVSLSIDESGRVTDVQPSIARVPYTTAFQEQFFAAARKAVQEWRFEPGKLARIEPQADGRPLVTGTETTASTLTVAFTFSSTGNVTSY